MRDSGAGVQAKPREDAAEGAPDRVREQSEARSVGEPDLRGGSWGSVPVRGPEQSGESRDADGGGLLHLDHERADDTEDSGVPDGWDAAGGGSVDEPAFEEFELLPGRRDKLQTLTAA